MDASEDGWGVMVVVTSVLLSMPVFGCACSMHANWESPSPSMSWRNCHTYTRWQIHGQWPATEVFPVVCYVYETSVTEGTRTYSDCTWMAAYVQHVHMPTLIHASLDSQFWQALWTCINSQNKLTHTLHHLVHTDTPWLHAFSHSSIKYTHNLIITSCLSEKW